VFVTQTRDRVHHAEGHVRRVSARDSGRAGSEIGGSQGTAEESPSAGRVTDETDYFRLVDTRPEDARSEQCFLGRGSHLNLSVFVFLLLSDGSECILYSVTEDIKHMSKPSDLVQGTLDMLLLKILAL
jgi:hypothetical protein